MRFELRGWIAVFLVVFAMFDVAGSVLAIVALKVAVSSRREDCERAEVLRSQNRLNAVKQRSELANYRILLKLPPSPKLTRLANIQLAIALKQNAAENCNHYAARALPW